MNTVIHFITTLLQKTGLSNWLIVSILSFLPIVESRLGIPIGIKLGLSPLASWLFAFIGSSLAAPFVLLLFAPIVQQLKKSAKSKKTSFLDLMMQKHADKITHDIDTQNLLTQKTPHKRTQRKKVLAVIAFVAIPGPMTGVWGASIVCNLLKLSYARSILAVTLGNLIASLSVLLFAKLFANILDYIIFAVLVLLVLSLISLLVKYIHKKVKTPAPILP
ncbi:MAG: small multi-drug export protein [Firmicutes bacterium]|nr:small multi-drug export protein [Bacillota bacterium]